MKIEEVEGMLQETGIPYRYHHFEVEEAVPPPFICWLCPGSNNFAADGIVYHRIHEVDIEVYTDKKNPELESKIEAILDSRQIFWDKTEAYIESENMYEVLYEMEV